MNLRLRHTAVIYLLIILFSLLVYFHYTDNRFFYPSTHRDEQKSFGGHHDDGKNPGSVRPPNPPHPIDDLIRDGRLALDQLLAERSTTLEQAAARYRRRRGRHPPPGFDKWFAEAKSKDAVVVEEFFDRVYHDISPLWALKPLDMRVMAHNQPFVIRVRSGKVKLDSDDSTPFGRIEHWSKLVEEIMPHIPDIDMPVNIMDESRILLPWETVAEYVAKDLESRDLFDASEAISEYTGLGEAATNEEVYDPGWIRNEASRYWDHLRVACPPDSPARNATALASFDVPVEFPSKVPAEYTYQGYIRNFTAAKDPCLQPYLRGMHGTFIEPISMATIHSLMPMFGESKLPQNNEILIPGAVYLNKDQAEYSGGNSHGGRWSGKKDAMVWRGVASGGRNRVSLWWHIHRSRFIQMMNGTEVSHLESTGAERARTFDLEAMTSYVTPPANKEEGWLSKWVASIANVGFTNLLCYPAEPDFEPAKSCSWLDPWFSIAPSVNMKEQFDYKYLPDIDGNSYSGRYRAFLLSTSLPLKSTIYAEWHDDRLIPWVHFVPFDNSFMDIYGVMQYFLMGHDSEAAAMAAEGREWAEKVLRRVDMKLYLWRLLLEYARVMDDERDRLAFVADLKK